MRLRRLVNGAPLSIREVARCNSFDEHRQEKAAAPLPKARIMMC
jgi:hypothetical protein